MKLIVLLTAPSAALAASWTALKGSQDSNLVASVDKDVCLAHAEVFIKQPVKKAKAIQRAMDHCALDKKVDDKNFVCPHYKTILEAAFRRESTTQLFDAKAFCGVTEVYVSQLQGAHKIPNLGDGSGFNFVPSKQCKPTVLASFGKDKKQIPAKSAPDFWYALCMNQDCAHFLPSRTRWCSHDHAPTHSASVCEHIRNYAHEEIFVMEKNMNQNLDADQICHIYDEFVEDTHVNVEAYLHVVHGKEEHPVPSPENRARALKSAQMKNQAGQNKLRDSAASPVKSGAAKEAPAKVLVMLSSAAALWASRA